MRTIRALLLPAVLLLSACDGGTLPATDPIHGDWSTPISLFLGTGQVDRAEHRYRFRPDGTYEARTLGYDLRGSGQTLVYENLTKGEYRLESGGLATNVTSYAWRDARTAWQQDFAGPAGELGPPLPYTLEGDRLTLHYPQSVGEHGQPIPASDKVYARR